MNDYFNNIMKLIPIKLSSYIYFLSHFDKRRKIFITEVPAQKYLDFYESKIK